MFGFAQDYNYEQDQLLESVTHLNDFAKELGIDTGYALSADMETEQLQSLKIELEAAIEAERQKLEEEERRWPACHIGPYSGGRCTICGGRQPS